MKIDLRRNEVRFLYLVVIALDLVFLFMNTPWMSLPIAQEGQPARLTSVFDFVKYQLDLKNAQNVGTWCSSVLLLVAGMMALLNCWGGPMTRKFRWLNRAGWSCMAFVLGPCG